MKSIHAKMRAKLAHHRIKFRDNMHRESGYKTVELLQLGIRFEDSLMSFDRMLALRTKWMKKKGTPRIGT